MNDVMSEIFPYDPSLEEALDETEVLENGEIVTLGHAIARAEKRGTTREAIATNLGNMLLRKEAELEGLKAKYAPIIAHIQAEIRYVSDRIAVIERELKTVFPPHTGWETMTNPEVDLFYSESESLVIDDPEAVPLLLTKEIPDNDKVREYLGGLGEDEPPPIWAHMQKKFNLQVKKGGVRQIANAKKRAKDRLKRVEEKRRLAAGSPQISENSVQK